MPLFRLMEFRRTTSTGQLIYIPLDPVRNVKFIRGKDLPPYVRNVEADGSDFYTNDRKFRPSGVGRYPCIFGECLAYRCRTTRHYQKHING